jgi:hypothetical protein
MKPKSKSRMVRIEVDRKVRYAGQLWAITTKGSAFRLSYDGTKISMYPTTKDMAARIIANGETVYEFKSPDSVSDAGLE